MTDRTELQFNLAIAPSLGLAPDTDTGAAAMWHIAERVAQLPTAEAMRTDYRVIACTLAGRLILDTPTEEPLEARRLAAKLVREDLQVVVFESDGGPWRRASDLEPYRPLGITFEMRPLAPQ